MLDLIGVTHHYIDAVMDSPKEKETIFFGPFNTIRVLLHIVNEAQSFIKIFFAKKLVDFFALAVLRVHYLASLFDETQRIFLGRTVGREGAR